MVNWRFRGLSVVIVAVAAGLLTLAGCEQEVASSAPKPHGTVSETLAKAKKENKLAMVTFSADWCGPCKELAGSLGDVRVKPFADQMVYTKVDIEDEGNKKDVDQYHAAEGIPYTLILAPDGSLVAEQEGWAGPGQFAEFLQEAIAKAKGDKKLADPAASVKDSPKGSAS